MRLVITQNTKAFARFLIYFNAFVLLSSYFALPAYDKMQGNEFWPIESVIVMLLIAFDALLAYMIFKGKVWAIWLTGATSLYFFCESLYYQFCHRF